ncbi:MAG: hypothetical protein K0Q81_1686 [Paenibacillus sp.]|nr:hypothetical protein [Paenibacillus sp.]
MVSVEVTCNPTVYYINLLCFINVFLVVFIRWQCGNGYSIPEVKRTTLQLKGEMSMNKHKKVLTALAITTIVGLSATLPYNVLHVSAASFTDNEGNSPYKAAIDEMAKQNVVDGYEDQLFKPLQDITRAELAKMVVLALDVNPAQGSVSEYSDVSAAEWYSTYVMAMAKLGAMKGENGLFQPSKPVTQGQMIEVVASVLKQDAAVVQALLQTPLVSGDHASRGLAAWLLRSAQTIAPAHVTSVKNLNSITLQVTFSAPLPKEEVDVAKAKENFVFDNGLTVLNIPQLKSGTTSTYIVPTSPQAAGVTYTLSYKGQQSDTFAASTEKLAMRSVQQVAADTFEVESSLADGVADYGYVVQAYSAGRPGAFIVDENNVYNGKTYQILSSMRDKKVYITPEGGQTMIAGYIPFTQATDGRQAPKFRLPDGQKFQPGVKYTVTSDWATIEAAAFTAKEIAPLSIQSVDSVNETTINVTLTEDPKDELFALRSLTLTAPDGTALTATYKLTSRKGAVGTFELQNGGKLAGGTTYTVTSVGNWAAVNGITVTAK